MIFSSGIVGRDINGGGVLEEAAALYEVAFFDFRASLASSIIFFLRGQL